MLRPQELNSAAVRQAVRSVLVEDSPQAAAAHRAAAQITAMPNAEQGAKELQELTA